MIRPSQLIPESSRIGFLVTHVRFGSLSDVLYLLSLFYQNTFYLSSSFFNFFQKNPLNLSFQFVHILLLVSSGLYPTNRQAFFLYLKPHFQTGEAHAIDPAAVPLVRRPGILRQDAPQGFPLLFRHLEEPGLRNVHLQSIVRVDLREAAPRLRVAVCQG